jgi:hypothetical protein
MQADVTQGYVHGRSTKVRAFWAVIIATVIAVFAYFGGEFQPLQEIGFWAAGILAAFLGLLVGPFINGIWQRRDKAFDTMDKWERGEISIADELKQKSSEIGEKVRETLADTAKSVRAAAGEESSEAPSPRPKDAQPPAEPENPEELVNKYLRRTQGSDDK